MATVNFKTPANLFIPTPELRVDLPEKPQTTLLPEQRVQALVIDAGLDRTIVEIGQHRYLAQGGEGLKVGQKLQLQVLQTQPCLEFKVLSNHLHNQLSRSLPLLARSFDWSQLIDHLPQASGPAGQVTPQIYRQLQQILNPSMALPPDFDENITTLVSQLKQLIPPTEGLPIVGSPPPMVQQHPQLFAPAKLPQVLTQLIKNLQSQLARLPKQPGQKLPENWYVETRSLLATLRQSHQLSHFSLSQRLPLITILRQVQQHPAISPQLSGEVKRVLAGMDRQFIHETSSSGTISKSLGSRNLVAEHPLDATPQLRPGAVAVGRDVVARLSANLAQLLGSNSPERGEKSALTPGLLGKLEGLLARLQQLPQTDGKAAGFLPGMELLVQQLEQLVVQPTAPPLGRNLGLLSQLLGLYLEPRLLQGEKKAALHSLKLSLLGLQKDVGGEVEEPLHRLELFQFCKVKLAEQQVQFLPLPFNQLEEGYLLAEKQSEESSAYSEGKPPLQMSLSLRLSALGNLRIDMLYDNGGLHLRIAGEDQNKKEYLQGCADELRESLQAIELHGVSFSADAKLPARQLQERLRPDLSNLLDARV